MVLTSFSAGAVNELELHFFLVSVLAQACYVVTSFLFSLVSCLTAAFGIIHHIIRHS